MNPLRRLGSVETAWWFGRRIAPRIAVTLAPAAGYGVERVPLEGGGVVAANHFSGIDHPLIGSFSPRPLYFLAKAELFEIPVLGSLLSWLGVFAVGYVVRPLGGMLIAHFGDRFGRKRMFTVSIFLMGAATLAMGLLPVYRPIGCGFR